MGEHKRSQQNFHVQVVTNLTLFKRRPVIVPAGGLTVLFNLSSCFFSVPSAKCSDGTSICATIFPKDLLASNHNTQQRHQ
jgi:hypothetical protein